MTTYKPSKAKPLRKSAYSNQKTAGTNGARHARGKALQKRRKINIANIDGFKVNKRRLPDTYLIHSGLRKSNISAKGITNLNIAAKELLNAYDVTVSMGEISLSDTDKTILENIEDRDSFAELSPELISAKDKFPDVNDSFYKLDSGSSRPATRDRQKEKIKDTNIYVKLAAALVITTAHSGE